MGAFSLNHPAPATVPTTQQDRNFLASTIPQQQQPQPAIYQQHYQHAGYPAQNVQQPNYGQPATQSQWDTLHQTYFNQSNAAVLDGWISAPQGQPSGYQPGPAPQTQYQQQALDFNHNLNQAPFQQLAGTFPANYPAPPQNNQASHYPIARAQQVNGHRAVPQTLPRVHRLHGQSAPSQPQPQSTLASNNSPKGKQAENSEGEFLEVPAPKKQKQKHQRTSASAITTTKRQEQQPALASANFNEVSMPLTDALFQQFVDLTDLTTLEHPSGDSDAFDSEDTKDTKDAEDPTTGETTPEAEQPAAGPPSSDKSHPSPDSSPVASGNDDECDNLFGEPIEEEVNVPATKTPTLSNCQSAIQKALSTKAPVKGATLGSLTLPGFLPQHLAKPAEETPAPTSTTQDQEDDFDADMNDRFVNNPEVPETQILPAQELDPTDDMLAEFDNHPEYLEAQTQPPRTPTAEQQQQPAPKKARATPGKSPAQRNPSRQRLSLHGSFPRKLLGSEAFAQSHVKCDSISNAATQASNNAAGLKMKSWMKKQ